MPEFYGLTIDSYQLYASATMARDENKAIFKDEKTFVVCVLGLAGEAGEVADLVKKHVGHGHPLDKEKLALEVGDVLWYCAAICTIMDWDLTAVMTANLEKLKKRYPDGFSPSASINRTE